MHVRMRYVLPLLQMALAIALVKSSYVWSNRAVHVYHDDMPGTPPAFRLLGSINAPILLPRALWFYHISVLGDALAVVLSAGLLWYWVALNVDSWRQKRMVLTFSFVPARLAADVVLIAMGFFYGFLVVEEGRGLFPASWSSSVWFLSASILLPFAMWSMALIFFFGRDFIYGVLDTRLLKDLRSTTPR